MTRTAKKLACAILLGVILVASPALAAVEVVTPSEPHGWFYKQGRSGSFEFRLTDQTTGNGSIFQIAKIPVITVDDVEELSWDFEATGADRCRRFPL
jgi:hypothetical protein